VASAFHDTDLVEYLTGSPFIDAITVDGWRLDRDGMLPIPDSPGLGARLDPDEVAKFTGGQQLF
jgi:L-alanine-DL-glutamate epimerase-like enolase superfamily enzyme